MERVELEAVKREAVGKSAARRLRQQGAVPGVIYGRGMEPVAVAVEAKAFTRQVLEQGQANLLVALRLKGRGAPRSAQTVMVKEVQRDPLTRQLLNVDFHKISLTEQVHTTVRVALAGEAPGVRRGGILEHLLREVEVRCLPDAIPAQLEVDVSGMDIGEAVHVSDLVAPPGVSLLTPATEVVAVLAPPAKMEEVPAVAAPVEEAEMPEPEVITHKGEKPGKEKEEGE